MAAAVLDVTAQLSASGQQVVPSRFQQMLDLNFPVPTVRSYFPKLKTISARPTRVLFGYMTDPRLRLKRPISIAVSRTGASVIASSKDLDEFGQGTTMAEALEDFSKTLAGLFFELRSNSDRLSDDLLRLYTKLQRYIEVRSGK